MFCAGTDFYVCDFKGHNVAVFSENGTFKHRIGDEKITCFPNGIDISDAGDILIGDSHGNRFHVACFSRDGVLQSEFECPYVKVSTLQSPAILRPAYVESLGQGSNTRPVFSLFDLFYPLVDICFIILL